MGQFFVERYPFEHEIENATLYNTRRYLEQNETTGLIRMHWMEDGKAVISCTCYEEGHNLVNANFSSFGGIEYTEVGAGFLAIFLKHLLEYSHENGLDSISLKLPSIIYQTGISQLFEILAGFDFRARPPEVNQHISVSPGDFSNTIKRNERKKLRQCHEQNFHFRKLTNQQLTEAYDLISDSRVRNNFPVSMTLSGLSKMFQVFKQHYHLFGVYDGEKLIATAVSIRVSNKVLYNFYHGDLYEYRRLSPTVMLLEGVYKYCQANRISILDLGVSSVNGELNQGLYDFKKNCGSTSTKKLTLELKR